MLPGRACESLVWDFKEEIPTGIDITPNGAFVYVANALGSSMSVLSN